MKKLIITIISIQMGLVSFPIVSAGMEETDPSAEEISNSVQEALAQVFQEGEKEREDIEKIVNGSEIIGAFFLEGDTVCQVPHKYLRGASPRFMDVSAESTQADRNVTQIPYCNENIIAQIKDDVQYVSLGSYGGRQEAGLGAAIGISAALSCTTGTISGIMVGSSESLKSLKLKPKDYYKPLIEGGEFKQELAVGALGGLATIGALDNAGLLTLKTSSFSGIFKLPLAGVLIGATTVTGLMVCSGNTIYLINN